MLTIILKALPLFCSNSTFICLNGGSCMDNSSVSNSALFGFYCLCPTGYSGEICQTPTILSVTSTSKLFTTSIFSTKTTTTTTNLNPSSYTDVSTLLSTFHLSTAFANESSLNNETSSISKSEFTSVSTFESSSTTTTTTITTITSSSGTFPNVICNFEVDIVEQSMIGIQLPSLNMSCQNVLDYVTSINQSANYYCNPNVSGNIENICCFTCKSLLNLFLDQKANFLKLFYYTFIFALEYQAMTCTDDYFDCPKYKEYCDTGSLGGFPINDICKRTCQICERNIK